MPKETPELPVSPEEAQIETPSFLDKLKIHKFQILAGVLGIFVFTGVVFGVYKFYQLRQAQRLKPCPLCPEFRPPEPDFCLDGTIIPGKIDECDCQWPPTCQKGCIRTDTGEEMSFSEAQEIALESECVGEGNLTDEYFCNQNTGTWWIDLDIEKEGCAPACVINVSTGEAEINWRCTGVIPIEERIFCKDPRPQLCTMECIVNPPYICGSDGKSYCSECQACASPKVEWYMVQDGPCEAE